MLNKLKETSITIKIGDPWELGEFLNWRALDAIIVAADEGQPVKSVIISLTKPFSYQGVKCEYFIVSPRYEGRDFKQLSLNKTLTCCFTRIPKKQLQSRDPFDVSWWRGGVAFIGEIKLIK